MHLQTVPKLLMSRLIPDAELDTGVFGIKTPAVQRCWVVPSDDVLYTDTSEVTQANSTLVKKKEMTIPGGYESVNVRVKFNIKTNNANYYAFGWIYKNGVRLGTQWYTKSLTYVEFTEDLTFSPGDTVELMISNEELTTITTSNVFEVCGREVFTSGTIGQEWRGTLVRCGDEIEANLSEDYLSEDNLSEDCFSEEYLSEDYLSEEDI